MIELAGYHVSNKFHECAPYSYYLGTHAKDRRPVLIKILQKDFPNTDELNALKHQYKLMKKLDLEGVARVIDRVRYKKSFALIHERIEGQFLDQILAQANGPAMNLPTFLRFAIMITNTLGQLHQSHVIHGNLSPCSIMCLDDHSGVCIVDLSQATQSIRLAAESLLSTHRHGLPVYISPEQTGRMNRRIDYRTDLYSLGVVFYHILTGSPPFVSRDPLELVHCHIARAPSVENLLRAKVPRVLCDIVLRLMAKPAEERYQSVFGLKNDLEKCLSNWHSSGELSSFPLGHKDVSNRFLISQKIYGREKELSRLTHGFEEACLGRKQVTLVSGYSGVGKTTLVRELYRPVAGQRGYFVAGKCEKLKANIPYSSLLAAMGDMVRQLLAESETRLQSWRVDLLEALKPNGQVMVDFLPELELLIGPQNPVPSLSPGEAQNRFNLVFQNFMRALCSKQHPLVLFIDDLQWVDQATLTLLERFIDDREIVYFYLVGSYRDNEVDDAHPLMLALRGLKQDVTKITWLHIHPLQEAIVSKIVADTVNSDRESAAPLVDLCFAKTRGNPFFLNQFLYALYEEHLIFFDESRGTWQWDMAGIRRLPITDNVVDLMVRKISSLPEETQRLITQGSCIGNTFDAETLCRLENKDPLAMFEQLQAALDEGLLVKLRGTSESDRIQFKFLHDRIQQAAYSLCSEKDRQSIHLSVGRMMLQSLTEEQVGDNLFDIVNHLNYGLELVVERDELDQLARLNLDAGIKAKRGGAYKASSEYLKTGLSLMEADCWDRCYELTLKLYAEVTEVCFLNQEMEEVERHAAVVLEKATDLMDKISVYEVELQAKWTSQHGPEALALGLKILRLLDVHFPENPSGEDLAKGLDGLLQQLEGYDDEALLELPEMVDPRVLATMRMLSRISTVAFMVNFNLFPLLIFKMIQLSLEHGNTQLSASAYVIFAVTVCGLRKDFDAADRFGKLALGLVDRYDARDLEGMVNYTYLCNAFHWKHHLPEAITPLRHAYQTALSAGNFEFAGYALHSYGYILFLTCRSPLDQLDAELESMTQRIYKLGLENQLPFFTTFHQFIENLRGKTKDPLVLDGQYFEASREVALLEEKDDHTTLSYHYFHQLLLAYHLGDFQLAYRSVQDLNRHMFDVFTGPMVPYFHFYRALALMAIEGMLEDEALDEAVEMIADSTKKLETFSAHAPKNQQHRCLLIKAERLRLEGKTYEAIELCGIAAELAGNYEHLLDEALAYEFSARLWRDRGQGELQSYFLNKCYRLYQHLGMVAKLRYLQKHYPELLPSQANYQARHEADSSMLGLDQLDLASLMKASQAISGEIVLSELLRKLVHLTIQNAGAQKGFLMLMRDTDIYIRARGNAEESEVIEEDLPVEDCNELSVTVVGYVTKTMEPVVLDDAGGEARFQRDSYIRENHPKSLLCMPILYQGRLVGLLYLENNLNTGAFSARHIQVLQMITVQAAISIVNAGLYANLEQKVLERTEELRQKSQQIMSSIRYAKSIQNAILPEVALVKKTFGNSMVIFLPKDIVSGDFFWLSRQEKSCFLAVVDCTGHGVPGGFMSMIGNIMLNQIVNEEKIYDPAQILKTLHIQVREALKQQDSHGTTDGMDMGLMRLDFEEKRIVFAGAKRPILMVVPKPGQPPEMIEIKGDRHTIGGRQRRAERSFTNHEIPITPGVSVYLTTDGYVDQPNSDGTKYGSRQFRELIASITEMDMADQEKVLSAELKRYQGAADQRDDITVVGLKLK